MKNFLIIVTCFVLLQSVVYAQSQTFGHVNVEGSVSPMGSAMVNIPIYTPVGRQGIRPNLSISYNSVGGSTGMGMGWYLNAVSAISRTGSNYHIDNGIQAGVELNAQDKFMLDGERLILISGTYGSVGSVYRTEHDRFVKVTYNGTDFIVEAKDGGKAFYGNSSDSKLNSANTTGVFGWFLKRSYDKFGNYTEYTYANTGGQILLTEINYTGFDCTLLGTKSCAGTAEAPYNKVMFEYINANNNLQKYSAGGTFNQSKLLSKIETFSASTKVRTYEMTYSFDDVNYYLEEVVEKNGQGEALPTVAINWSAEGQTSRKTGYLYTHYDYLRIPGDFDGDGSKDLLVINGELDPFNNKFLGTGNTIQILKNNPANSVSNVFSFRLANYQIPYNNVGAILVSDVDADGDDDILLQVFEPNYTLGSGGCSQSDEYRISSIAFSYHLIQSSYSNNKLNYSITPNHFPQRVLYNPEFNLHLSSPDQMYKKINIIPLLGDVDGDGLPDLIEREMIGDRSLSGCASTTQPAVQNTVHVYLSTRRKLLSVPDRYASYGPVSKLDLYPMDFNGNGKLDLMNVFTQDAQSSILEYNNLTHSFVHLLGNGPQGFPTQYHKFIQLGDFNGDGKTDLLYFVNGNWHIAYSNGQGFHEYNATSLWFLHGFNSDYCWNWGFHFELGDYNGDGRTDILERHNHHSGLSGHSGTEVHIYYSTGFGFHKKYIGTNNLTSGANRYTDTKNIVADFNGDGKSDVFMGYYINANTTAEIAIESFDLKNKRVSGINYSDVHSFEFSYALLNKYNKYFRTSDANAFSMAKTVNIPLYVVSSFTQKVTGFTDIEIQYAYKNLLYHTHGRGLLGFTETATVKIDGGGTNRTTISKSKQDAQLSYKLNTLSTEVFNHCTDLNNPFGNTQSPIAKTTFEYGVIETSANSKTVFPFCSYLIETDYLKHTEKSTCFSYDVYGNMIHSAVMYAMLGSNGNVEYIQSVDNKFEQKGTWIPASLSITRSTNIRHNGTPSYVVQKEIKNNNWGIPVEVESFKNNLHYYVKELTSYDQYGNIVTTSLDSANNASGNTFRVKVLSYNNGKELTKETNALGSQKEVTIEPIYGNILYSKQDDGTETTYQYNTWGQLVEETNVGNNVTQIGRSYVSSPTGAYYKITKTGNLGNWVTEYYNARNQKIQKDYSGLGSQVHRQRWIYNTRGLLVQESNVFDPQNASSIKWNHYSYDAFDRLKDIKYENTITTYAVTYDKNVTTENRGANRVKETHVDASGNVVKVIDNGGTITYKYGAHNKLVQTDANGSIISIVYNVQLNKIELHEPNAGVTQYDYNAFGDLIAQVDANGNTFFFHYDEIGRLIKKAKTNEEYLYSYNNSPGLGKNNKLAEELYKVNNTEVHRINYSHTADGLVSTVSEVIKGATTYTTTYEYDTYLRLFKVNYPNITVTYGYDASNNLVEMLDGNSNLLWRKNATFTDGRTNRFELGNGFVTELSFNADAQLQNIMSTKQGFPNALNIGYNFNLLTGNLEDRYFNDISKSEQFYYDNLDRLTSIIYWNNGNPNSAFDNKYYSYANNGNIETINNGGLLTQNLTYHNTKINAVTKHKYESSLTPVRVPQASVDEHTYTYNSIGKLATINQDVLDYELTYGVNEQRIEAVKKEYGQVVYTKQYINTADMEVKNGEELTYLYAEGQPFAIHKKTVDDEMMYYLHLDHLGSIMSITDQSGIVVETRSYDAWGRPQDPNTWSYQLTPFGALNITDRGYTFHEHLIEFSLINMNGRMYDPVLGRVISPDNYIQAPDNTQSFNRYNYCFNNPLKYSDPSGDIIFTAITLIAAPFTGGASLAFLPYAIGADVGMWQGGTMANGTANPFKWDYSSARTWGYMGAGAAIGAASSYAGAGAGALLAKTTTLTANHVMYGALTGAVSGAVSGFAIGGLSGVANNGKWNWNSAWSGLGMGAVGGFVMGGATTAISNWIGGRNIWNGSTKVKPTLPISSMNNDDISMNYYDNMTIDEITQAFDDGYTPRQLTFQNEDNVTEVINFLAKDNTMRRSVRNYDVLGVSKVQFESVLARHSSNLSQTGRYTFGGNVSAFSYVSKNNGHSIDFKLFEEQILYKFRWK